MRADDAPEWWDEPLLPEGCSPGDEWCYASCALEHSRFHELVHHPAATRMVTGAPKAEVTMPYYLTKKDRKRIRRQARAEREAEKKDKVALGLIPAPEPRFKLSNFMRVLGDQAVADPSKVEKKVLEQIKQRLTNHEMRNQAQNTRGAPRDSGARCTRTRAPRSTSASSASPT